MIDYNLKPAPGDLFIDHLPPDHETWYMAIHRWFAENDRLGILDLDIMLSRSPKPFPLEDVWIRSPQIYRQIPLFLDLFWRTAKDGHGESYIAHLDRVWGDHGVLGSTLENWMKNGRFFEALGNPSDISSAIKYDNQFWIWLWGKPETASSWKAFQKKNPEKAIEIIRSLLTSGKENLTKDVRVHLLKILKAEGIDPINDRNLFPTPFVATHYRHVDQPLLEYLIENEPQYLKEEVRMIEVTDFNEREIQAPRWKAIAQHLKEDMKALLFDFVKKENPNTVIEEQEREYYKRLVRHGTQKEILDRLKDRPKYEGSPNWAMAENDQKEPAVLLAIQQHSGVLKDIDTKKMMLPNYQGLWGQACRQGWGAIYHQARSPWFKISAEVLSSALIEAQEADEEARSGDRNTAKDLRMAYGENVLQILKGNFAGLGEQCLRFYQVKRSGGPIQKEGEWMALSSVGFTENKLHERAKALAPFIIKQLNEGKPTGENLQDDEVATKWLRVAAAIATLGTQEHQKPLAEFVIKDLSSAYHADTICSPVLELLDCGRADLLHPHLFFAAFIWSEQAYQGDKNTPNPSRKKIIDGLNKHLVGNTAVDEWLKRPEVIELIEGIKRAHEGANKGHPRNEDHWKPGVQQLFEKITLLNVAASVRSQNTSKEEAKPTSTRKT